MHKYLIGLVSIVISCFFAEVQAKEVLVSSPDGTVTVAIGLKANKPYYTVKYGTKTLLIMAFTSSLTRLKLRFSITSFSRSEVKAYIFGRST